MENLDKQYKRMIAQALQKRMDEDPLFKAKCESSEKTLEGVLSYVKGEARRQSEGGCAVIADEEVYQWAVHYVIEDSLDFEPKAKAAPAKKERKTLLGEGKPMEKPVEEPKKTLKRQVDDQLTFDFGGEE